MALRALESEQIVPTVQVLLAFLEREDVVVPANMLEGIVSGKSILRALANGQIVLAQDMEEPQAPAAAVEEEEKAA